MPRIIVSCATVTRFCARGWISPTAKVALQSPCTPWMKAVTSTLRMSPDSITVESGMPWQMTSFRLVQQDFSKPR